MFWLVGFDIRDQRLTFSLEKKKITNLHGLV